MPKKTKRQVIAENLALQARLAQLEAELAKRPRSEAPPGVDPSERERVADALTASEARYRRLFETAKDGILILDADTGRVTDSNPFLEQMLGYSHAELSGRKLWELGAFKDITASRTAFQELQTKEYIRYEDLPLQAKGGQRRQVEFISNLYLVDSAKVIQCNIRDITDRKLAEAEVQRANEALTSLVTVLRRRDSEMTLLNRMNDLLQSCEAQDDAHRVIALTAAELFNGQSGCLAVLHPSGQYLETVSHWGEETLVESVFALETCWALRRGQPHEVMDPQTALLCKHFVRPPERGYLCLPLMVQGETFGVFYLDDPLTGDDGHHVSQRQLVVSVGEAIKLSLSNLKLGQRLHEQATRDPLTGLFNRRYLVDTLPRELHRILRRNAPLSLAMLDLDYFKRFNDTFGHDAGDLVLCESGRVLQENIRKSDIACRYGGEEFVLVLPDSSLGDTGQRLEEVRLSFERLEIHHSGQRLATMTVSAGIAAAPEHGSTTQELLHAADEALYAAKQAGRNCVVSYRGKD